MSSFWGFVYGFLYGLIAFWMFWYVCFCTISLASFWHSSWLRLVLFFAVYGVVRACVRLVYLCFWYYGVCWGLDIGGLAVRVLGGIVSVTSEWSKFNIWFLMVWDEYGWLCAFLYVISIYKARRCVFFHTMLCVTSVCGYVF